MKELILRMDSLGVICLRGRWWQGLYRVIDSKADRRRARNPGVPLILSGWHYFGDLDKAERFRAHLRWADDLGAQDEVLEYLKSVDDAAWYGDLGPDARRR